MDTKTLGTDREVAAVSADTKRQQYRITKAPGLVLAVQPTGAKSWRWRGRIKGHKQPIDVVLGAYPAHKLADAREWAAEVQRKADAGVDPREARKQAEARKEAAKKAVEAAKLHAVDAVFERYMAAEGNQKKTARERRTMWGREVSPHWGSRYIGDVKKDDAKRLILAKQLEAPVAAARLYALVRRVFEWSLKSDPDSPLEYNVFDAVAKPPEPDKRKRHLNNDEIRWLWAALEEQPKWYGDYMRLLLLTGCRHNEIHGLLPTEIVWDHFESPRLMTTRTKNNQLLEVPLVGTIAEICRGLTLLPNGSYCYSDSVCSERLAELRTRMEALAEAERPGHVIPHWQPHDLRRTLSTRWAGKPIGARHEVIESAINHVSGFRAGVAGVYNRHEYWDEQVETYTLWCSAVECIVSAGPAR